MPVVRRLTRQVNEQGSPTPRITAVPTAQSYGSGFGATVANAGEELFARQQHENRVAAAHEYQKANQIAVTSAAAQLATHAGELEIDAQTKRGNDAFDLPKTAKESYDKRADEIAGSLTNDDQRQAFQIERLQRGVTLDMTVQRHVAKERQAYDDSESKAYTDGAQSAAIANALDPHRVATEMDRGALRLTQWADRRGLGEEATKAALAEYRSQTHVGVIANLLDNEHDTQAKAYYEEVKDQINGEQRGKLEKAIEESTLRGEAQKASDQIWAASGGDPDKALDDARKIKDAKLRDDVEKRIDGRIAENERKKKRDVENTMVDAANRIDKGGLRAVPPSVWMGLGVSERAELTRYAKRNDDEAGVKTDLGLYYKLMTDASTDPEAFAKVNLLENISRIGKTEFKQLVELQSAYRKGEREKASKGLEGFRTNSQVWADIKTAARIDDDDPRGPQLRGMIDELVLAREGQTGKKLEGPQIQAIADHLLSTVITNKDSYWWQSNKTKPKYEVLAEIPSRDRLQIEDALRARKLPIDADTILKYYNQAKGQ